MRDRDRDRDDDFRSKRPKPGHDQTLVIDYKNPQALKAFLTDRGKIVPGRTAGLTAKQQRALTKAVKRARMLALLPFAAN